MAPEDDAPEAGVPEAEVDGQAAARDTGDVTEDAPLAEDTAPQEASPPEADGPGPDVAAEPSGPVHVDRIGAPTTPRRDDALRVVVVGVPETAQQRLQRTGAFDLLESTDDLDDVAAILVSTRLPTPELSALLKDTLAGASCPIVALAHTGGESAAAVVMSHGGSGVLAEGNESALRATLGLEDHDPWLVDVYARHAGHSSVHLAGDAGRDSVTGLPDHRRFAERLDELGAMNETPRIGLVRVIHLGAAIERLTPSALRLLRRRLLMSFAQAAARHQVELYVLDDTDLAFVGPTLSPNATERLGSELTSIAQAYSPGGIGPLEVAIGHAGSEAGSDLSTLRELAQRALQVAVVDRIQPVIGAEGLAVSLSSTTELEAALRIVGAIEPSCGYPAGHGERVGVIAAELASSIGLDPNARTSIELAARLHDIGKAGLPTGAMSGPGGLSGELLDAYRTHPVRGWSYLRASAGPLVSSAVRGQHEWWDGSGFPDGLAGGAIPLAARVLAAAHVVEELRGRDRSFDELPGLIGTRLDPELASFVLRLAERRVNAA